MAKKQVVSTLIAMTALYITPCFTQHGQNNTDSDPVAIMMKNVKGTSSTCKANRKHARKAETFGRKICFSILLFFLH